MFVSHKLNEVKEIADRVTILRDGQWIDTRASSDLTPDMMAQMMVGRELSDLYPPMHEADVDAELVLEVQNLRAPSVDNVSFSLRKGEILGFSGLIGSGRTAVFETICGLAPFEAGTIRLFGRDTGPMTVAQARDLGLAYLTKDRKEKGLLLDKKMRPNLTLFALPKFVRNFRSRQQSGRRRAQPCHPPLRRSGPRQGNHGRQAVGRQPAEAAARQDHGMRSEDRHHR